MEDQVSAGSYSNGSEYMRDLVRADQKRLAKAELEQVLLTVIELTPQVDDARQRLRDRA